MHDFFYFHDENEAVKTHTPRHRDSKTKKPRHRDSKTKKPRHRVECLALALAAYLNF